MSIVSRSPRSILDTESSTAGLCAGDAETGPVAGAFDNFALAIARGFDILVRRNDMRIVYVTTAGTPAGNENLTGAEVLQDIKDLTI